MMFQRGVILGAIFVVVLAVAFLPLSSALGLSYDQSGAIVSQGENKCISYDVYNPGSSDIKVKLEVSSGLQQAMSVTSSSSLVTIPANTNPSTATSVDFCFKASSTLYDSSCTGAPRDYTGSVIITDVPDSNGVSGSAVSLGVAAPFTLRVTCGTESASRGVNWIYPILTVLLVIAIVVLLIVRTRQPAA